MKVWIALFVMMGALAKADSFYIDKDGKRYLCESTVVDPGTAQTCADTAYRGPFSKEESLRLCSGARDNSPAECANKAYSGPFSKEEAIALCSGARTPTGPVDCANKAYAGPFTKEESLSLCSGGGSLANAECAAKAYSGPYTKEEAVRLCKANPDLLMKALDQILMRSSVASEKYQKMSTGQSVQKQ